MNYESLIMANRQQVKEISGKTFMSANLCKVEKVNQDSLTIDAFIIETSKTVKNVPICSPVRRLGNGLLSLPEIGSLCLMLTIGSGNNFIIGFLSYSSTSDLGESLNDGEILLRSSDDNFLKLDNSGNISIMSKGISGVSFQKDLVDISSITIKQKTLAKEAISGSVKNIVRDVEKWYDKPIESILSTEELIDSILKDKDVIINKPEPILEIQRGNVVDDNDNILKLQLYEADENNPELCYRLAVNKQNNQVFSISIGKDGSCIIKGKELIFDFEKLDMTKVKNIYPDPTQYDWSE